MVIELGRLARDVELKMVEINGEAKPVLNNAIAIQADKDTAIFVDFTAWGKTAETIAAYLKKGDELLIKGELRNKKRKIADDKEITTTYILLRSFDFTHGSVQDSTATE